jgi:hypothetical protein
LLQGFSRKRRRRKRRRGWGRRRRRARPCRPPTVETATAGESRVAVAVAC